MDTESRIARLLAAIRAGDPNAKNELAILIQDELREIAHRLITKEQEGHSWLTTDLVQQWFVKVSSPRALKNIEDRVHLTNAISAAMRHLLTDHARARRRIKRGGGIPHVPLDNVLDTIEERRIDVVALDEALEVLRNENPRPAALLEQNFFGGFGTDELSELWGVSLRTIQDDLKFARARLLEMLGENP